MNAEIYTTNHDMQLRGGKEFLQMAAETLRWNDLSDDIVLDIGCGPGTYCTEYFFKRFPNIKKFIGIDTNEGMIEEAKRLSTHANTEFAVMNIENDPIPDDWRSKMSKIVSLYCLNWMHDQNKAFRQIFDLLKPGGESALFFILSDKLFDSFDEIRKCSKWKHLIENVDIFCPESHYKKFDASHYKKALNDIGFEVILCETVLKSFRFPSDEAFRGFIISLCIFTPHIPPSRLEEFYDDLFIYSKKSLDDSFTFHYNCIEVLIRRPL